MSKFSTIALIVAAGSGSRFGIETPKQYALLGGKPLLLHSLETLLNHPKIDAVVVVINHNHREFYDLIAPAPATASPMSLSPSATHSLIAPAPATASAMSLTPSATKGRDLLAAQLTTNHKPLATLLPPIHGGKERQDSVRLGLKAIAQYKPSRVLIHDAARPALSSDLLDRLLERSDDAVIPALPIVDTVKRVTSSPSPLEGEGRGGGYPAAILEKAKILRKNMTEAEKKLWKYLSGKQSGAKFRRQQPIGNYIVDFYNTDHRLIIEVDGGQHANQKSADEKRIQYLEQAGYRVLRFWNNEVLENIEGVMNKIYVALQPTHPCPPPQGGRGQFLETLDRNQLYRVQTPQCFDYQKLVELHENARFNVTDDAGLFEAAGLPVATVMGDIANEKITTLEDWVRMQKLYESSLEVRVGSGYDVHAFHSLIASRTEGGGLLTAHEPQATNHITLCGIKIPHNKNLEGHSDADVGLHALVDALLGAASEGDIGVHFPPSEAKWKGADSSQFVTYTRDLIKAKGGVISHVDVTLVCEKPKITPHREAMRERIAELLELDISRVSVKATTTEKLGFTGREEGIAAQAVATVKMPV